MKIKCRMTVRTAFFLLLGLMLQGPAIRAEILSIFLPPHGDISQDILGQVLILEDDPAPAARFRASGSIRQSLQSSLAAYRAIATSS